MGNLQMLLEIGSFQKKKEEEEEEEKERKSKLH